MTEWKFNWGSISDEGQKPIDGFLMGPVFVSLSLGWGEPKKIENIEFSCMFPVSTGCKLSAKTVSVN